MDESRCTCTPCLQFLRCQFHMSTNVNAFKYNRKTGISDFPCHCQKTNSFFLLNKVDNSSLKTDIIFFIICPSFLKHVAPWSWHQIVRNPGVHVHGDGVKRGTNTLGYVYTTLCTWKTCDTEIKNACDHCLFRFGCKMVLCLFTFVLQTHIWKDLELHTFIHFSLQLWITSSACINLLRIFSLHKPWAATSECVGEHYTRRL